MKISFRKLRDAFLVIRSGLFDASWYLRQYPSFPRSRLYAFAHFVHHGCKTSPCVDFCAQEYELLNPDVKESGQSPFLHYIMQGRKEGRRTSLLQKKPLKAGEKIFRIPDMYGIQALHDSKRSRLRERLASGKPLRLTFLVGSASMFSTRRIFEIASEDPRFTTKIVVIQNTFEASNEKTYRELASQYGEERVIHARQSDDSWFDPAKESDIVFYNTPYDCDNIFYNVRYSLGSDFLPIMTNYGYTCTIYGNTMYQMDCYTMSWRVFLENDMTLRNYRRKSPIDGSNGIIVGYVKADGFQGSTKNHNRKCILIAVHHSVAGGFNKMLNLSNFLRYSDNLLNLPKEFPQLDFIFRPHPALFPVLESTSIWTKDKIQQWIDQMQSYPNVKWSDKGDYYEDFAASDAMVQDCGSFLPEYFYTEKPQCFMLKRKGDITRKYSDFGRKCLEHSYLAYEFAEVEKFIRNIATDSPNPNESQRIAFAREQVKINYPSASKIAIDLVINDILKD